MKILNIQTKNINSAALVIGFTSALSAVLGLLRDRLLAFNFGAGNELDVYYAAFRIPDFVSMVLIMGSISAAVIPIFSEYITKNREEAWKFLSNLFNVVLFALIIVCVVLAVFTPFLVSFIAPGFSEDKREMVVLLTRIMFLSPIILGTSNIISSILQVFRRFLVTSLSPVMYNIGIILGILFFVPQMGLQGLAWGVVFGALLHLLIQLPALFQVGFKLKKIFDFGDLGFKKMVKLTLPRSFGLAATQINFFVITAIASTLFSGSVAIFHLAESLSRPFYILVGISFSTAVFPKLALSFSKENKESFLKMYSETFSKVLYLIVPLSILLFLLKDFVVDIILKAGKFGFADSRLAAACLGAFAVGLFARSLLLVTVKAFYALQDSKTPAISSVLAMMFNIGFSFLFVYLLSFSNPFQKFLTGLFSLEGFSDSRIVGLPLALSLSFIFQFIILHLCFKNKIKKYINE